jgi:steroid delta-isomerase-like uncharacterized protein
MDLAANKAVMRKWLEEGWGKGNVDVADEVVSPAFTVHGAGGQAVAMGPDGVKALVRTWREAFPDGQMIIQDAIAEGDLVAIRQLWLGTHLGDFYGAAPTGQRVACAGIAIDRTAGGQIVGGWGELDMLGLMQQVGAIPAAGPRPDAGLEDPTPGDTADDQPPEVLAQNKTVVRRFLDEVVNAGGDRSVAADVLTPDFVWRGAGVGLVRGQEAFLGLLGSFAGTFPDLRVTVEDLIAQGDKVVARYHWTGTHRGDFQGIPATGTAVTVTGSGIYRLAGGRIAEEWWMEDLLGLMRQLGAIPPTS